MRKRFIKIQNYAFRLHYCKKKKNTKQYKKKNLHNININISRNTLANCGTTYFGTNKKKNKNNDIALYKSQPQKYV